MQIKVRAVSKKWTLLYEAVVQPDGTQHIFSPLLPIHFANGEQLLGIRISKPVGDRGRKAGVFRLYRTTRGHPAYRASRNVKYELHWVPRPHAFNQPQDGRNV